MGSVPCHPVPAAHIDKQEQEIHEPGCRRSDVAHAEGSRPDDVDVRLGGDRMDHLQGGEHGSGMGIHEGDDAAGDVECELPVLYPVEYQGNQYIHHHDAGCGVATERERTWVGFGRNKKDMDTSSDILCVSSNYGSRDRKKYHIYLFSVLIL